MRSTVRTDVRMNRQEIADKLLRTRPCHAALGRNPEWRSIATGHVDACLGSLHAILGVNQPEIQLRVGRKLEITQWLVERIVRAIDWNRHVNVSELVRNGLRQRIGEPDHLLRTLRLDEMTTREVPIAEMHADLHISR